MTKTKYFTLFALCSFVVLSIRNDVIAQERNVSVGIGYGGYTYFKSTWFQQHFKSSTTNFPSIGLDIPISKYLTLNSSILYLSHVGDSYYGGIYYDNVTGRYTLGMTNYHTVLKEILLLSKVQMNIIQRGLFSIAAGAGPMVGYVDEKNVNLNLQYDFVIVGVVGGLTVSNRIENSPFLFFINADAHYAYRGKKSLLQEYDGYLINLGVGLDL